MAPRAPPRVSETPGPPCPFRPTLRVTGNLITFQKERETRQSFSQLPRKREVASTKEKKPRSVSVAIRTVFLLPEEEGTVLGAPRGVSLCRDITNFAIVPYHTRQGRSPGTLHCNAGYDPHQIADPPTAGDVGAHRPASTQKLSHPPQPLREEAKNQLMRVFFIRRRRAGMTQP